MKNNGRMTAYINPQSSEQFKQTAEYTLANGNPAINVVCIFDANYAAAEKPYLRAKNNDPPTTQPFKENIQRVLGDGSVQYLQNKGLTVLLTITNAHHPVGWSQFTSESDAMDFAQYLKTDVVDQYGLDGIDIDDEYSTGTPNDTSLVMVTTLMRQIMPDKLISKALFQDSQYFQTTWNGHTLADNLSYGAEITYGEPPQPRLAPYPKLGLSKNQLSLGFWAGDDKRSANLHREAQWLKDNGYAGMTIFGFEKQYDIELMGQLVNAWYGPGNWNLPQGVAKAELRG